MSCDGQEIPLIQKRLENQRHILQIRSILARMRDLEGKKSESDESQDEKRHREEL